MRNIYVNFILLSCNISFDLTFILRLSVGYNANFNSLFRRQRHFNLKKQRRWHKKRTKALLKGKTREVVIMSFSNPKLKKYMHSLCNICGAPTNTTNTRNKYVEVRLCAYANSAAAGKG